MAPSSSVKKGKSVATKKPTAKPSKISAEYVEDSDSDEEPAPAASKPQTSNQTKLSTREKPPVSKSKASKLLAVQNKKPNSQSQSGPQTNGSGAKANGTKSVEKSQSATASSSDDSSDESDSDSDSSESGAHGRPVRDAPTKSGELKTTRPSDGKTAGDTSDTETESESDESESLPDQPASQPSVAPTGRDAPPPTYVPPKGFKRATIDASSTISSLFTPENLKGKQLWHITLPRSVPISHLKEVATQTLDSGGTVFSHKSTDYAFAEDRIKRGTESVLVPMAKKNKFEPIAVPISRVLNLQQAVKLPEHRVAQDDSQGTIGQRAKPKPQQPAGLKMRYRPFGDVDSEAEEEHQPEFRMPVASPAKSRKNKRHASQELGANEEKQTSPSKKKRKKDVVPSSSQRTEPPASQGSSTIPSSSEVNGLRRANESAESRSVASQKKHEGETPEERAARKAARAKRKEEKRQKNVKVI